MKYVALIRGVNVGGNSKVSMSELKKFCDQAGLENVITYINSGNVIFDSNLSSAKLAKLFEKILVRNFNVDTFVVILTKPEIDSVIKNTPNSWLTDGVRCYVAFTLDKTSPKEIIENVQLKVDVDSIDTGPKCVYMTTLTSGLTKSGFTKMVGTPIYKQITMRNKNTLYKIAELMK